MDTDTAGGVVATITLAPAAGITALLALVKSRVADKRLPEAVLQPPRTPLAQRGTRLFFVSLIYTWFSFLSLFNFDVTAK
jgi:hypothetical protein